MFKAKYWEVSHAIGIWSKDASTGQFLAADDTTRLTIPSDWKAVDVSTAYIVQVPPYWCVEDPRSIVKGVFPARHIPNRLRWSVGEMRTATWRITAEGASESVGRVFHTDGTGGGRLRGSWDSNYPCPPPPP